MATSSENAVVSMQVDASRPIGPMRKIWNWFGYDEPNYTTMPYGRKLLRQLAGLHAGPVYIRTHNLLTSGDGTPALKWGSTGAYSEGADGDPKYSWTILDGIFDAYVDAGVTPFVQIGFMPEALSTGPAPYRHDFPSTPITTGWAYPPKDYVRWADLIEASARHLTERYGRARVAAWPWEVWNEPDGLYWRGTFEEYCRLFDVSAAALRRVLPEVRIGGPHTCGPGTPAAALFLRRFLDHCAHGRNAVSGETGTQLDFIAFHAKGKPVLNRDHVRMGLSRQLRDIETGLEIVTAFPEYRKTPVVLGESDPEGCAACPTRTHPENAYRDGALYGAYVVEATARTMALAERHSVDIEGAVTWAFEFEGTPFFAGYRELATNGIAKPVLNAFRMMGRLGDTRLAATSSGALPLAQVLADGVRGAPSVDLLATRRGEGIAVLVWHYHDDAGTHSRAVDIDLNVTGVPASADRTCRHFRMDHDHSNAHTKWLGLGLPQDPSPEAYSMLEVAGELQEYSRPCETVRSAEDLRCRFELPRHAVSLIEIRTE